jgi:pimeloyl-ACP methyl ester carboxylesterase
MSNSSDRHLSDIASGETIILVPGLDGTALLFYRQIPLLARHFNVVAFPLPDDPDATMDSLVDDLVNLIREVAPDGAILLGESFGGALSMSTALTRPDLVRGLVILNSFPWLSNRPQLHAGRLLMRLIPWAAMPHIRRGTEARIHSSHTNPEDLAEFHERMLQIGRRGYRRRLDILRTYDIRERLSDLRVPTLLLAGDEDRLLPSVRWARYMGDRIPGASVKILSGYGHVCLITHDFDVTEYVAPWWEANSVAKQ